MKEPSMCPPTRQRRCGRGDGRGQARLVTPGETNDDVSNINVTNQDVVYAKPWKNQEGGSFPYTGC